MLLIEQYLMIYLLAVLLLCEKDTKILCGFLSMDFLVDNFVYTYFRQSPQEYLMIITFIEIASLFLILQFLKGFRIRNLFILCYIPTILNPLFLLSIDHWITRDDLLSYYLFIFCSNVARYSNEVFLTYIIYTTRVKNLRINFWHMFVGFNYITIFFR